MGIRLQLDHKTLRMRQGLEAKMRGPSPSRVARRIALAALPGSSVVFNHLIITNQKRLVSHCTWGESSPLLRGAG